MKNFAKNYLISKYSQLVNIPPEMVVASLDSEPFIAVFQYDTEAEDFRNDHKTSLPLYTIQYLVNGDLKVETYGTTLILSFSLDALNAIRNLFEEVIDMYMSHYNIIS